MKRADWIRSLSDEELADYIYSVFVTGKLYGRGLLKKAGLIDYKSWLQEEFKKDEN